MGQLLAFDLSTTVAGYSIFDETNGDLIHMNYYRFKEDDLVDRANELVNLLESIINQEGYDISTIGLEENLKSFRAGGTNASAMLNTSKLNFCFQYLIKYIYKKTLTEINVNTARSACFPGFHVIARAQKGKKQKEIAFEMAVKELGADKFPKKVMKSGPRKGDEVYVDEASDMSDSWVIGKAILNIRNRPIVEKKVKTKKEAKKQKVTE